MLRQRGPFNEALFPLVNRTRLRPHQLVKTRFKREQCSPPFYTYLHVVAIDTQLFTRVIALFDLLPE
jgi:hypothetical protein